MRADAIRAMAAVIAVTAMALAAVPFLPADADTVTVDGIEYELKEAGGVRSAIVSAESLAGEVVIPSHVEKDGKQYTVTGLSKTLRNNQSVTSVSLPPTIVSLDPYCFSGCSKLTSVTADGVLSIPSQCFSRCASLESVHASSATSVGGNAFDGCSSLSDLVIGTPEAVSDYAFRGCSKLTSFELNDRTVLGTAPFANSGIKDQIICGGLLVYVPADVGAYAIPPEVVTVGAGAFYGVSLGTLHVPRTVLTVSDYGFYCSKIRSIEFDPEVAGIGNYAFADVAANSSALEKVTLPTAITYIGEGAFQNCTSLKSIDIPKEIAMIDTDAFNKCTALESVGISSATMFGDTVFSGCSSLRSFVFPEGCIAGVGMFRECKSLVSVGLCASITDIPDYMFYKCSSMTAFEIPGQVRTIGKYALSEAAIAEITIPSTISPDGIDKHAFRACQSLRKVTFMGPLVNIPDYCFFGCRALESIDIHGMVTTSNGNAFNNTGALKEIVVRTGTPFGDTVMFDGSSTKALCKKDATNGCTYVDVKVPAGSGYESKKVLLSADSSRISIDGSYAGFAWSALDSVLSKGGSFSSSNPDIRLESESVYRGTELLYVSPGASEPTVKEGTSIVLPMAVRSLKNADSLSIPESVTEIRTGGISAPELRHLVVYGSPATVEGSLSSPDAKAYFKEGKHDPSVSAGMPLSGYFVDAEGGRVLFTIDDAWHSTFKSYMSGRNVGFEVGLMEGYTESEVSATVGGKAVPTESGRFVLRNVSQDMEVVISGIRLNTYEVVCDEGVGFSSSVSKRDGVIHGEEVLLGIRALPGYSMSESFAIRIDGSEAVPFHYEDGYAVYKFIASKDVRVTVEGVVPNAAHVVKFDSGGGSVVPSQNVLEGASASVPKNPSRPGHSFLGWFDSPGLDSPYGFGPVTEDAVVYAKWADDRDGEFQMTFSADGGYVTAYANGSSEPLPSGAKIPAGSYVVMVFHPDEGREAVQWVVNGTPERDCSSERMFVMDEDLSVSVSSEYYATGSFINSTGFDTPTADDYVQSWEFGRGGTTGASFRNMVYSPAVIGGFVYAKNDNVLLKIDADDGRLVKSVETAPSFNGFYEYLAVGNGLILDGITGKVFDTDLEQKFVLSAKSAKTFYYEGRFYVETPAGTSCYAAEDEDPRDGANIQRPIWTKDTGSFVTAYEGGTSMLFHEGFVMVCGFDSDGSIYLQTSDAATGEKIDRIYIPQFQGQYTNKGYIDISEGYATVTTYAAGLFEFSPERIYNVASVRIGEDGVFDHATLKVRSNGTDGGFSTALIVSGGLGYVSSGGTFTVYDMETMEPVASKKNGMLYNHGSMAISTGHPGKVYAYVIPYNASSDLYVVEHDLASNSLTIGKMENVAASQYSSQQIHYLEDGGIVYTNDSGKLFCIRHDVPVQSVVLDKTTAAMAVGETMDLDAAFLPETAGIRTLSWASDDESVATVQDGKVTAVADGTARITATSSNGRIATCEVTVGATSFTITWKNWDGSVISMSTVEEGATPTYSGQEPAREPDEAGVYKFSGWVPALAPAYGDAVYTAGFSVSPRLYTIVYVPGDHGTFGPQEHPASYGSPMPAFEGTPTGQEGYSFAGWSPEPPASVSRDMTFTAMWSSETYFVTYIVDGAQVGDSEAHAYGETVTVREKYEKEGYDVTDWSTSDVEVSGGTFVMPAKTIVFTAESSVKTYVVTWKDWDGSVIASSTVKHGEIPECAAPSREPDAQYAYAFSGWIPEVVAAVGDAEYVADYDESIRSYTVRYLPGTYGTFAPQEFSAPYGSPAPAFEGTPTGQDGHRFTGWSPDLQTVTGDADYMAQWAAEGYAVIYLVDDVQAGVAETHPFGEEVAVREKHVKEGFEVSEWSTDDVEVVDGRFSMPANDVVFEAESSAIIYMITWKNWDGAVLLQNEAAYGSVPSYPGPEPSRPSEEGTEYKFAGWSPKPAPAVGDAEYVATFDSFPTTCTISYLPGDLGSFDVQAYDVPYGSDTPAFEGVPTGKDGYVFAGWSPEPADVVTGDAEYVAVFSKTGGEFTVRYLPGAHGTFSVQTFSAATGEPTPAFVGTPSGDAGYRFAGWSPEVSDIVAGDADYEAAWVAEAYEVTYEVDGTMVWEPETHLCGETVPVREKYVKEGFEVSGWIADGIEVTDGSFVMPAQDVKFKAGSSPVEYTATWKDWDGTVLAESRVRHGETPAFPGDLPSRDGYAFAGWSPEPVACHGDVEYTAIYEKTDNKYSVIWKDWDSTVLHSMTVRYGVMPAYPFKNPTRASDGVYDYTFKGWRPAVSAATSDKEYVAEYSRTEVHVPVKVSGVTLDKTSVVLGPGCSAILKATVLPSDAEEKGVTWSSDRPEVASVDADGKVSAVGPGAAHVKAVTTDGGFSASCEVSVTSYEYVAENGVVSAEMANAMASAASPGRIFTVSAPGQRISVPAECMSALGGSGCSMRLLTGDGTSVVLDSDALKAAGSKVGTVAVSVGTSCPELAAKVPSGAVVRDVSVSSGAVPVTVSVPFSGSGPVQATALIDGKAVALLATVSSGKAEVKLPSAAPVAVYVPEPEPEPEEKYDITPHLIAGCVIAVLAIIAAAVLLRRKG